MRVVAEQHAVGRRERQRVAGAFFPAQMLGPRHQLLALHRGELREGAIGRLVAPNPLAVREHRVPAIAVLIIAVILIAMDHHLIADLPARDLVAHRPDNTRRVGPGNVVRRAMHVKRAQRHTKTRPDAVVIHTGCHHQHDNLMAVRLFDVDNL